MDYYDCLGVAKNASIEEITTAYLNLARQWHPDMHPEETKKQAETKIKEINLAFDILHDANKRFEYDQKGYVGRRPPKPTRPKPPKPKPPPPPKPEVKYPHNNDKLDIEKFLWHHSGTPIPQRILDMIDCTFFGGDKLGRGRNIMTKLYLTQEQLQRGGNFEIYIKRREFCGVCGGDGEICVTKPRLVCDYNGYKECIKCHGVGLDQWVIRNVTVPVPSGSQIGQQITVRGEGEPINRKEPGLLRVVLLDKQ